MNTSSRAQFAERERINDERLPTEKKAREEDRDPKRVRVDEVGESWGLGEPESEKVRSVQ